MGAYAYCHKCGNGIDPPDLEEIVAGHQVCRNPECGAEHANDANDRRHGASLIMVRIVTLEARVAELHLMLRKPSISTERLGEMKTRIKGNITPGDEY